MKTRYINLWTTCYIILLFNTTVKGQSAEIITGVIVKNDSIIKIENALIFNKRTLVTTRSGPFGTFEMPSFLGDTLEISCEGYVNEIIQVTSFMKATVYLEPIIALNEVIITGHRAKANIEEISSAYSKANSIYYKGKPPLKLLSPFGGKPITFFRELFSKSGKRVRRFESSLIQESQNDEVDARFNNRTIASVIPIREEEIESFKASYRPRFDNLKQWSEYDLYEYIKESFKKFQGMK